MNLGTDRHTGYPSVDKPWMKYYSQDAIAAVPFEGSIFEHIYCRNADYADDDALDYFGNKITYGQMFDRIERVARALVHDGVKEGDNVALLMTSCPELVYTILALNKLGAVANLINPLFTKEQIAEKVNETNANLMFALDQFWGIMSEIKDELCVKKIVVIKIEQSMPPFVKLVAHHKLNKKIAYTDRVVPWISFAKQGVEEKTENISNPELPAIMVYSSGTTGASKGIVLMNKGMNATIAHYEFTGFPYKRKDTYLQIVPVWFSTGMVLCLLMPLCVGMTVIIEPVFSEENFTKAIYKYKPNLVMGATSLWLNFLETVKKKPMDLSFLTYPITGGEKILPSTEMRMNEELAGLGCKARMITGYGMCELGATATSTSIENYKYGTAGYPIKGVTVAAFDEGTNAECKYHERGEIRVLTPARMKGYYKRPEATSEFFWKDSDGQEWGCTGDVGYVDEDGFVFVEGRAVDYFTTKAGKRIYCFDVEDIILQHQAVYQCEVVGVSNSDGAESAFAFVVLQDKTVSVDQLEKWCRSKLDADGMPTKIMVLDKFPVKPSGKRNMEKLKEMAAKEA